MEDWVDLGGWLHTEMVTCPQAVTHRSTNPAWRAVTSLSDETRYRYATPPTRFANKKTKKNMFF